MKKRFSTKFKNKIMKNFTKNLNPETVEKLKLNCKDEASSWEYLSDVVCEAVYNKMSQIQVLTYDYTKDTCENNYLRNAMAELLEEEGICKEDIETLVDFVEEETDFPNKEIEERIEDIIEFLLSEYLETISDEDLDDKEKVLEELEEWLNDFFNGDSSDHYKEFIESYFEDKIDEAIKWEKENRWD